MKRFKILIPMVILALSLNGCGGKETEDASAIVSETVTPVEVKEIAPESIIKELTYGGKTTSDQVVNVTPKTGGRVATILVDVGDKVEKGQPLFTIDKEDLEKQLAQLQASLAISNAGVASAQNGLNQVEGGQTQSSRLAMENGVKNAQSAVDTAKKSFDDISKKYEDYKVMLEAGVISQSDFNSVELGYTQAKNGYEQAQNGLTQAQESLRIFNEQTIQDSKNSAQAGVDTATASREAVLLQIKQLQDTIADTTVVAPISGTISARNIEVTNMVSSASVPFVISTTESINVDVKVSERIINKIAVGDQVKVNIGTISNEFITGTIKTINTVADATGTYPVSVSVDNGKGNLKPGMFANVVFTEESANDTVVVPVNTVIENATEKYVFTTENGVATKVIVETGIDNGEYIQIVSGIENGDQVVVAGQSYIADGSKVKVVTGEE